MTIIHTDELRDMTPAERANELDHLQTELLNERAVMAAGGAPENPGRITELRKAVARVKTIQREEGDGDDVDASDFAGDVAASEPEETDQDTTDDETEADEAEADEADAESDESGDETGEEA